MTVTEKQAVKTAFYKYHVDAGAKMVEFAGYLMPIQYQGITADATTMLRSIPQGTAYVPTALYVSITSTIQTRLTKS